MSKGWVERVSNQLIKEKEKEEKSNRRIELAKDKNRHIKCCIHVKSMVTILSFSN